MDILKSKINEISNKSLDCLDISNDILGDNYYDDYYKVISNNLWIYYTNGNFTNIVDTGKHGTLIGTYTTNNEAIQFNGGYGVTETLNMSKGSFELYCKIPSSFIPKNNNYWYSCTCLFGCELSQTQQDFGIIIDKNGYFAIGYSTSSIASTNIKANDNKYHHLVLTVSDTDLKLYIDGDMKKQVTYSMSGTIPSTYRNILE